MKPELTIILCRPQLPENIGAVARAMANCGLEKLRLVAPRDGWPNDKAWPMASGADWVLEQAELHNTTESAVADLQYIYCTTARPRHLIQNWLTPKAAAADMQRRVAMGHRCGVLFGPERAGLDNQEIALANAVVTVPLNPNFLSLNLAQTVLIIGYEWFQQTENKQQVEWQATNETSPANHQEIQIFIDFLVARLLAHGLLSDPNRRPITKRNMQAFLKRAGVTEQDVKTLYGIIHALERPVPAKRPSTATSE